MNKEDTTEVVPVTIEDLMNSLNAEDDEKPLIENVILPQAQSYVDNYLNVNDMTCARRCYQSRAPNAPCLILNALRHVRESEGIRAV